MYGADAVPEPTFSLVTRWAADPYTRGSYSYTAAPLLGLADGFASAHAELAVPLARGTLVFAGEHTSPDYPATVQGAYSSGVAAACAVLKARGRLCPA